MLEKPVRTPCSHISHGVRIHFDWTYHRLAHWADQVIGALTAKYPRAYTLYTSLLSDPETLALWDMTAYMTVEKMRLNDHGQMHAQIVAANALTLLDLLHQAGIEPDVITSNAGTMDDACVAVLGAALLHDIGNQIARDRHEVYSVLLAQRVLARILPGIYTNSTQCQILTGFILSAIACHDCSPAPVTLEGAIVAVADAADMTQGRGQVAFDQGKADIHAISAMAVHEVQIEPGNELPIHIEVSLNDAAGVFQVEKQLAHKLILSGLDRYISVRVCVAPPTNGEEGMLHCLILRKGEFEPESAAGIRDPDRVIDPVCGMVMSRAQAVGSLEYGGRRHHFCSQACMERFRDEPHTYLPIG
jgi:hypothetical protein